MSEAETACGLYSAEPSQEQAGFSADTPSPDLVGVSGSVNRARRPREPLCASTSLYLDILRLAAAFAVFLAHCKILLFPAVRLGPLFGQSREAVAVFFVLSGFVIRFVSLERESSWSTYLTARTSRIYSVAILSVLVTIILDCCGSNLNPAYYAGLRFYVPETMSALLSSLTFTNELWFRHSVWGTNEPYWSLGFEVCYYVFFGLISFLGSRARLISVAAWFCICGPNIALYLPLWFLGVVAYDLSSTRRIELGRSSSIAVFASTIMLYFLLWFMLSKKTANMYDAAGFTSAAITATYLTLIGLLVAINILTFNEMARGRSFVSDRLARAVRWAAGSSFTLYLLHLPIIVFVSSIVVTERSPAGVRLGCCIVTLGMVLLAAEMGERRKSAFLRAITEMLSAFSQVGSSVERRRGQTADLEIMPKPLLPLEQRRVP